MNKQKYVQILSFFTVSNCYHFCVIIFPCTYFVLSFMLSFDVIIFHGQQMLSFLCYHFPLYIFCVIFMLSFDVMSDSHPAYFLPIATTSNKNFWKCNNYKWEMQMFVNLGTRGNKTGLLWSLSAFPSFIKPGTRQTGLTGRFQKSFDMNSWHLLRKGEKSWR